MMAMVNDIKGLKRNLSLALTYVSDHKSWLKLTTMGETLDNFKLRIL